MSAPGPTGSCVPGLYFHHVTTGMDHYTNCPPAAFRRYVAYIAAHYDPVTPSAVYDALFCGGPPLPPRPVTISLDDAYADNLDAAIPILLELRVRAAIFVITDYIGRPNDWNKTRSRSAMHMSAHDLRELHALGFEIGAHSRTHPPLTKIPARDMVDEVAGAGPRLSDALGAPVRSFAYPYGFCDASVVGVAAQHYDYALSTVKSDFTDWRTHRHELRRGFVESAGPAQSVDSALRFSPPNARHRDDLQESTQ